MTMKKIGGVIVVCLSCKVYAIPSAYREVASEYNIPPQILYAIAFTESGYQYQSIYNPWPWTLNVEGKAYRFNDKHSMLITLHQVINNNRSVDIGIMQINWRWHKHRFKSVPPSIDPYINLKTGAEILVEQYKATGDWWQAVGRYHAPAQDERTIKRAKRYSQRVKKHWLRINKEMKVSKF